MSRGMTAAKGSSSPTRRVARRRLSTGTSSAGKKAQPVNLIAIRPPAMADATAKAANPPVRKYASAAAKNRRSC